jgi:endonuclease/exonuclease/phosphatase family metal-dependent hydrolase
MLTAAFMNSWGGNVPGYIEYVKELASDTDIICLSEVHHSQGAQTLATLPDDDMNNRVGPIHLKQFSALQEQLSETHHGRFDTAFHGFHDCQAVAGARQGLAMFSRVPFTQGLAGRALIHGPFDHTWDGERPATRIIQSQVVPLDNRRVLLIAHVHGLWIPTGKVDCHYRDEQTERILAYLRMWVHTLTRSGLKVGVVLGGDFNYTRKLECYRNLIRGWDWEEGGAPPLVLNAMVPDGFNTRTQYYPADKPTREADFVLTSPFLWSEPRIYRDVPSDHAVIRTPIVWHQ